MRNWTGLAGERRLLPVPQIRNWPPAESKRKQGKMDVHKVPFCALSVATRTGWSSCEVGSRFRASVAFFFLLFLTNKRKGLDAQFSRSAKIRNWPTPPIPGFSYWTLEERKERKGAAP